MVRRNDDDGDNNIQIQLLVVTAWLLQQSALRAMWMRYKNVITCTSPNEQAQVHM